MKVIIYNHEGRLSVFRPADKNADLTALAKQVVPAGISFEIVNDTDIPTDRTFRNAWEHDTSKAATKVKTNMVKAKVIAHTQRRATRDEAFKPLDREATVPSLLKAAEVKRQAIRDADAKKQIAIDAATTESELKAAMK